MVSEADATEEVIAVAAAEDGVIDVVAAFGDVKAADDVTEGHADYAAIVTKFHGFAPNVDVVAVFAAGLVVVDEFAVFEVVAVVAVVRVFAVV